MAKCTKCGAENWAVVARIGALETWRCESCGQEETIHVFDPSTEPLPPSNLEPVFRMIGHWTSKASSQQISEIKSLIPVLRNTPISELLRKSVEQSDIELGRFTESEMSKLEEKLQQLGMAITRLPVSTR